MIEEGNGESISKKNKYYRPELFKLIMDQLYLMPLWSGVIIRATGIQQQNDYLQNITRVSNNPVENHFGYLKKHIFNNKKVYPSEMAINIYKMLKAKFTINYEDFESKIKYNYNNFKINTLTLYVK